MSPLRSTRSIMLLASVLLILAACGGQPEAPTSGGTGTESSAAEASAAPSEAAEPSPAASQAAASEAAPSVAASAAAEAAASQAAGEPVTFTFAHSGPIRTMDAPVTWFGSTHWLTNGMYDCLIWRTADGSGYEGQAAESWEQVDPTTWRFVLRPNLTFQNGEPLDAEAVKWNLDRVRTREDFMVQPQWLFIKDVTVVDPTTVEITTNEPHAYFEYDVSYNGCELLPPKYIEEVGEEQFAKEPVGSGPYRLVEFTENERYVFEAWDDYWSGRPEVDRIVYQVIPEQSSQVAALIAGQVDFVPNVAAPNREQLESNPNITLLEGPANQQHLLYLRQQDETGSMLQTYPGYQLATKELKVRQAISRALDRQLLAEVQGNARPGLLRIESYYPEARGQYAGEEAAINYYDPELAKQLLTEAGYDPDAGNKPVVQLDTVAFQNGNEKEVAEVIASLLEDVGFTVNLNVLDGSAFAEQILTPGNNRDIALVNIGGSPALTPTFYQCTWQQPNFSPCSAVQGEWEQLGQQILNETDEAARLELWEQWWDYYVDQALEVTLYHIDRVMGMNSSFEWTPRSDGWFTFRDLKLKE